MLYRVNGDSVSYEVGKGKNWINIKDENDFLAVLEQVYERYKPELAAYAWQRVDTTLSGMKGIYLHGPHKDTVTNKIQVFVFLTVVNGHVYTVECRALLLPPATNAATKFFRLVRFGGENFPFRPGRQLVFFRLGQMVGYVVIVGLFVFLLFLVKKWTAKV